MAEFLNNIIIGGKDYSNLIVVGIDTGNRCMKSAHKDFISGVQVSDARPPLGIDVLELKDYDGKTKFYTLSGKRSTYQKAKYSNNDYFAMSMIALAKEFEYYNVVPNDEYLDVVLAVGLPPSHFAAQAEKFKQYFRRGKVDFVLNGKQYHINIVDAFVNVQAFSAIALTYKQIAPKASTCIVDIGGYTTDIISLDHGNVDTEHFKSFDLGLVLLCHKIADACEKQFGYAPSEEVIFDALERNEAPNEKLLSVCQTEAKKYADEIVKEVGEYGVNMAFNNFVFVGGGSGILENFIRLNSVFASGDSQFSFITDIHANALGYEILSKAYLNRKN